MLLFGFVDGQYLTIDSGGNMRVNSLRPVIIAWLNSFHRSRVGVGMNCMIYQGRSGKRFERSSRLYTALHKSVYLTFNIQQWGFRGGGVIPRFRDFPLGYFPRTFFYVIEDTVRCVKQVKLFLLQFVRGQVTKCLDYLGI